MAVNSNVRTVFVKELVRGPRGIAGSSEEEMPYAKRTDYISDDVFYRGSAVPGTATTAAGWRIARVTISADGDSTEEWASGNALFTKVWNDRASYTYS